MVHRDARMRAVDAAVAAGAQGVYLACTTGMEAPRQVFEGVREIRKTYPTTEVGVHLHARNGMALASAITAMQAGAHWLEGAFGGLGGDLWAPGPPEVLGNAPYEDLLHMMSVLGIETGVDLDRYLRIVERVSEITGWSSLSAVTSGGRRADLIREGIFDGSTK
jgi:hydroxymethylglutaryl-CoA lyase